MAMRKGAIAVLGGSIWCKDGVWQSNGLDGPGDRAGATFDRFRVFAASFLAHEYPRYPIIASGGEAAEGRPSIAGVFRSELLALGVPAEQIVLEENSSNTHQQLKELARFAKEQGIGKLLFISNEWHLPRITAMIECSPVLRQCKDIRWIPIAAEEVMLRSEKSCWKSAVAEERNHPRLPERIRLERQGTAQVRGGSYKLT